MPDLGMSRVRSVIAVTRPFLRLKTDVWKVLFRSLIEIATLGGGGLPFSRLPEHSVPEGFGGSNFQRSIHAPTAGHRNIEI